MCKYISFNKRMNEWIVIYGMLQAVYRWCSVVSRSASLQLFAVSLSAHLTTLQFSDVTCQSVTVFMLIRQLLMCVWDIPPWDSSPPRISAWPPLYLDVKKLANPICNSNPYLLLISLPSVYVYVVTRSQGISDGRCQRGWIPRIPLSCHVKNSTYRFLLFNEQHYQHLPTL